MDQARALLLEGPADGPGAGSGGLGAARPAASGRKDRDAKVVQAVTGLASADPFRTLGIMGYGSPLSRMSLKRDAPLFARSAPLTLTRPWEAEGVSRRTWGRWRDASDRRTTQVSQD